MLKSNMESGGNTAPSSLSLFSGAGGLDLGVSYAGFRVLASIEIDPHCCETLREAGSIHTASPIVIQEDIRQVEPRMLMDSLNLQEGQLDLLFGGSPCQSFSQIGKQGGLDDERGRLLFEFARFARVFQPKAILMEQVKGFLSARDSGGRIGGISQKVISELESLGYSVKIRTLNAADFGVPQLRERVFIVAIKPNFLFTFPEPSHSRESGSLFHLPSYLTVGQALKGLEDPASKGSQPPLDSHYDVTPAGDRMRIKGVPEGGHLSAQLHLPIEQRKGLTRKDTTKFRRLASCLPSLTLRCGEIFYHPLEDRYLTPREYMRLHGYPDNYLLRGPIRSRSGSVRYLDQHRQVANSVPPPLAKAIAAAILESLKSAIGRDLVATNI